MQSLNLDEAFEAALAAHQAGRVSEAEQAYRRILQRQPDHADALHLLGVVGLQTGHLEAALELIERAAALRPDAAVCRNNLGQVLERLGRDDDARAAYEAALALDPAYAEAVNNLGHVLQRRERLAEAEARYREAIRLDPDYAEPHSNLGNVLKQCGELDEAIACYRRAIELRPDLAMLHSNLLLALHYHAGYGPEDLAREHALWAERHAAPLSAERIGHVNEARPDRRLRIGYVSADFREHPAARFVLPLLRGHDRAAFEVFVYSDVTRPDAVTELIRAETHAWRDIAALGDSELASRIRADRVDILVDLAAHSARNRLPVFARKPAPVQLTWLAYCSTTGVDAIDYRLTDRYLDPPGADTSCYAERTIRLPGCYWCYSAPALPGEGPPPTARRQGPPTFGCLNNPAKVTEATLELWAHVLHRVPEARLLLHAVEGRHRERVVETFGRAGLPAARVAFVGRQSFQDYLETYGDIDVGLDPFPFTGGTTTCDALWMGVPVVSMTGRTAVSRGGMTLLSNVGLAELVARHPSQYVEIAAALIRDRARLAGFRDSLRARLEASPVMDARGFVRGFEETLRTMWHAWCRDTVSGPSRPEAGAS